MFLPLANITQTDPLIIFVLGLVALVPVVNGVLSIIRFFKTDPPAHHYALRQEVDRDLEKLEARVNARIATELAHITLSLSSVHREVQMISKTLTTELKEMNRAIGNLEGSKP